MRLAPDMAAKLVRRLIRHRETNRYFVREGEWTPDPESARHFESVKEAYTEVVRVGLEGKCLVALRFEGAELDVSMPL